MLVTEPIVLLLSIYMAFIYGLLYLFLTAYPLVFQRVYGMNPGVGGLPFLGMVTGQVLAGTVMLLRQPAYMRKLAANNDVPVPEWRLPEVIAGGIAFTGGLFWLGWSGYKADVHWIVPTLSGILSGFGIMSIFLQALNYLVDAYLMVGFLRIHSQTIWRRLLTFLGSSPRPRLQQTRFYAHCVARGFRCLRHICLRVWASSGPALC